MISQWLDWFLWEKLASMAFLGGLGIIGIRYRSFLEVCIRQSWIESGKKQCDEFSCYVRGLVLCRIQTMSGVMLPRSLRVKVPDQPIREVDRTRPKQSSAMKWKSNKIKKEGDIKD